MVALRSSPSGGCCPSTDPGDRVAQGWRTSFQLLVQVPSRCHSWHGEDLRLRIDREAEHADLGPPPSGRRTWPGEARRCDCRRLNCARQGSGAESRSGESALGNLVADVQLWVAQRTDSAAQMIPGGLRANVTYAAVVGADEPNADCHDLPATIVGGEGGDIMIGNQRTRRHRRVRRRRRDHRRRWERLARRWSGLRRHHLRAW